MNTWEDLDLKSKVFHNHEMKIIRDNLASYRKQIETMHENHSTFITPRYWMLRGKIELCMELIG